MNSTTTQTNKLASKIVCNEYDDYLTSKGATKSYLRLEEKIIQKVIEQLPAHNRRSAIDFGCGTGRVSALIDKYIEKTIGVDVSTEMLALAKSKAYINKTEFIQYDFNVGLDQFFDQYVDIGLICASFGVGSCVDDIDSFLDACLRNLNAGGQMIMSFYNKNYRPMTSNKTDLPFASVLDSKNDLIFLQHKKSLLSIKIHSYTYDDLKSIINNYEVTRSEFYFLPTLSGLIKSDLLNEAEFLEKTISIDESLLHYSSTVSAPYILLVIEK